MCIFKIKTSELIYFHKKILVFLNCFNFHFRSENTSKQVCPDKKDKSLNSSFLIEDFLIDDLDDFEIPSSRNGILVF